MGRFNEIKVFVPMKSEYDQANCHWLTVGIGGDTLVEKEFKTKYPECKIYGVEASPDQYLNFADYGTIIPFGVAVENGSFPLTLREGEKYITKNITVLSMASLLDEFIGTRKIHYMTIDIEGFEYSILEQLPNGRTLAEQGIVFCQIDAELHDFKNDKEKIKKFLHQFDMENSDYVPIYSSPFLTHQKVTFVNFRDEECLEAFDLSRLY
ncbi:hypothetical protein FO519_007416 [Halicephalobus sp. NKZ332]|nr:hypothetical protein FO519_007416 [Halicephalobus sp. NKZ332]